MDTKAKRTGLQRISQTIVHPTISQRRSRAGLLFALPCAAVIILMMLSPMVRTVIYSFSEVTLPDFTTSFTGADNFRRVLKIEAFSTIIWNTVVWIIGSVFLRMTLGFTAALIMDSPHRGTKTLRIVALLPWTIPSVVSSNAWRWMLQSDFGLINGMLENIGLGSLTRNWLGTSQTALPTVLVAYAWAGFPFVMMMILAGLQSIPGDLYESGAIDGANGVQQFFYITIPSLKPVLTMVLILEIISGLNAFDLLYNLTGGGPGTSSEILGLLIYRLGFSRFDFAAASAISTMLIAAALLCFVFYAPAQKIGSRKKGG